MRKAIGDSLIPKGYSLEKGLALIKSAGFDGVELWLGDKPWFQMNTPDSAVGELLGKVHDAGLVVSDVCNTLDWDENISARDPKVQAAAIRHVERQIETAQLLETDAILVVAGLVTEEIPYNEVYARCVESLRRLGETAAKAKVKIGCENCCAEQRFLLSAPEFRQFLNEVNSPFVGLHMDVGNVHETGFPEQWIEINGPRITRVHVKDVMRHRGRCGNESVYTNLFLGDNNWPAIRAALDKVRYDGWIIAEMERVYNCALDQQFYDTATAMDRFIQRRM